MQIKLEHLTKRFGDTVAVNDLSITLESGRLIALLGPSGCGKTTTLNMISGILPVSGGSIFFDDRDVTSLPPEKRGIGLVFQNYALYPHMTVLQNICFPMEIQRIPKKERIRRAVARLKQAHNFSRAEEKWIDRMEKYLLNESVLSVHTFDESVIFREKGGFAALNKLFNNQLESIVTELNTYLYDDGGLAA